MELFIYSYYKYRILFRAINIVMDSVILDQLNNPEKEIDSEVIKAKKGRKKKTDTKRSPKMNEEDTNYIRER